MVRIDPDRNMQRAYRVELQSDLFGPVRLYREWGRIGSGGQERVDLYPSEEEAQAALKKLVERKVRRGYRITDQQP